jgi:hypothetical protein
MNSYKKPPVDPETWPADRRARASDPQYTPKTTREASDRALYVMWKKWKNQKEAGTLSGLSTETVRTL